MQHGGYDSVCEDEKQMVPRRWDLACSGIGVRLWSLTVSAWHEGVHDQKQAPFLAVVR